MKYYFVFLIILFSYSSTTFSSVSTGSKFSYQRPACRNFADYATRTWSSHPDSMLVVHDGTIQFEFYADDYGPDRPHALWSVGKTITGALLGIAQKEGQLSLEQKLREFYPQVNSSIQLKHLFYSDTGIHWNENTLDIAQNSVLNMLFGEHNSDMSNYVVSRPQSIYAAGERWQYNTGTPIVAMAVLKKIYAADYAEFPWKKLFHPLNIHSMVLERDQSGTFITSGNIFATPRDMAKIGQLYLQNGMWHGQEILSHNWIKQTFSISPGFQAAGTTTEQIVAGLHLVYGGMIWLNRQGRADLPPPFPKSPGDMSMALGREGQFILIIPSKKMVLVRTGYGGSIDDRIDGIVTRALACFDDPATPLADYPPAPVAKKAIGISSSLKILRQGMKLGYVQSALAKWVCSCHFISGLSVDSCLKQGTIPFAKMLVKVKISNDNVGIAPSVLSRALTGSKKMASAFYQRDQRQFGCQLTQTSTPSHLAPFFIRRGYADLK